jgi:hypothetical protein
MTGLLTIVITGKFFFAFEIAEKNGVKTGFPFNRNRSFFTWTIKGR